MTKSSANIASFNAFKGKRFETGGSPKRNKKYVHSMRDYFPKLSDRSLVWRVILHPQRLRPMNKWFLLKRLIVGVCEKS